MRPRRKGLEVSTFPFLAVLLCAMGSLILLLLVLDRRAKFVARMKLQQAAQTASLDTEAAAAKQAELARAQKAARDLAAKQEADLQAEANALKRNAEETARTVQTQTTSYLDLQARFQAEAAKLTSEETDLSARQAEQARAGQQAEAAHAEQVKLTQSLLQLEQTIADMKALRERSKKTFSLVPYKGRLGGDRKPIYLECTEAGVVFHPDRLTLAVKPATAFLGEAERRIAKQSADVKPYFLILIRPDGITNYYKAVAALTQAKIDFGNEFIEPDWILDFADDGSGPKHQPWQAPVIPRTSDLPPPSPKPSMPLVPSRTHPVRQPQGNRFGVEGGGQFGGQPGSTSAGPGGGDSATPGGGGTGNGTGAPAGQVGIPGGGSGITGGGGGVPGGGSGTHPFPPPPVTPNAGGGTGPGGGSISPGTPTIGPTRRGLPGATEDAPLGVPPAGGSGAAPGGGSVSPGGGAPGTSSTGKPGVSGGPTSQPTGGSREGGGAKRENPSDDDADASAKREPRIQPKLDPLATEQPKPEEKPARRPVMLTGNRDWVITLECHADSVVLLPAKQRFAVTALEGGGVDAEKLPAAVQAMIDAKQKLVRPGEPPYRPIARLLVWPDGARSYYAAYPLLRTQNIRMRREEYEAEEEKN